MKLLELNQYVPKYIWKYKKKLFVDFFFFFLFVVFHHNRIDQWPHIESYSYFATISFNTTFIT